MAQIQLQTGRICGYGSRQAGGGFSPIPSVKAYHGALPDGENGIEFETEIKPTSAGFVTYWHAGAPGVIVEQAQDLACIPVTVTRVVP